jgi:hypothetical protein
LDYFQRFVVASENWKTFSSKFQAAENYIIYGGYFHRSHRKLLGYRHYPQLSFGGLHVSAKNGTDLFLTGFS